MAILSPENHEPRLLDSPTPLRTSIVPDPTVPSTPSQPWIPLAGESGHNRRHSLSNQNTADQSGGGVGGKVDIPQFVTPRASNHRHLNESKHRRLSLLSHVTDSSGMFPPPPPPPDGKGVTPPTAAPALFHSSPLPPPSPPSTHFNLVNPPTRNKAGQIQPPPPRPVGEVKINNSFAPPPPPPPSVPQGNILSPSSPDASLSINMSYHALQNRPPEPSPSSHGLAPGSTDSYFAVPSTLVSATGKSPIIDTSFPGPPHSDLVVQSYLTNLTFLPVQGPTHSPGAVLASSVNKSGFDSLSRYPTPLYNARIHAALHEDERDDTTPTPRSIKLNKPPPPSETPTIDGQRVLAHPPGPPGPPDVFIPPPRPPSVHASRSDRNVIPCPLLPDATLSHTSPPSSLTPGADSVLNKPPPPPPDGAFVTKPPPPPPQISHPSLEPIPPPPPPPSFHPFFGEILPPPPAPLASHARFDVPPPPPDSYPALINVPPPPPDSYTFDPDIPPPPPPLSAAVIISKRSSPGGAPPLIRSEAALPFRPKGFTNTTEAHLSQSSNSIPPIPVKRSPSQRFNQYEHDEIDEIRKGHNHVWPPRGPASGRHGLTDKTAGQIFSTFSEITRESQENEEDNQPPAPDTSSEAVHMEKVRAAWKRLQSKRAEVYDLRGQMAKQREHGRSLREADREASYRLASHIKKTLANDDSTAAVNALAEVEGLYMSLQNARVILGKAQTNYDELDNKLDRLEEEVANHEAAFFDLLGGPNIPTKTATEEKMADEVTEKPVLPMPYDLLGISADISAPALPEMYIMLEEKVAKFNLCYEDYQDLVSLHSRVIDDVEKKRSYNPYYVPDEYNQEVLDNFSHDHARLEKAHIDSRESVIKQIEACIKADAMPDIAFIACDILWILADRFSEYFRPWLDKQPCDTSRLEHDVEIDLDAAISNMDALPARRYPLLTAPEFDLHNCVSNITNTCSTTALSRKEPTLSGLAGLLDWHAPSCAPVTKLGEGETVGNWFVVTAWQEQQLRSSPLNTMLLDVVFREHIGRRKRFARDKLEKRVLKKWYTDETRALATSDGCLRVPGTPPVSGGRASAVGEEVRRSLSVADGGSERSMTESFDKSSLGGVYCKKQEGEGYEVSVKEET